MAPRVLVTGASGNVGREVVRACRDAGLIVRGAATDPGPLRATCDESVTLDFLRRETWAGALTGCEYVFLLRPPPLGDMRATLLPFIDAAFAQGVRHLVFLSVAGAESKSWVPHRKVEDHLAARFDRWTAVRPGFFAQNLAEAYLEDVRDDRRLFVPAGTGRVAFLDVADVGDLVARVLSAPGQFQRRAIRLAGPQALTFAELASRVSAVVGHEVQYQPASVPAYAWHLWRHRRLPLLQIAVQTVLHVGLRSGEAAAVDDEQLTLLGRPARAIDGYLERERERWRGRPEPDATGRR